MTDTQIRPGYFLTNFLSFNNHINNLIVRNLKTRIVLKYYTSL